MTIKSRILATAAVGLLATVSACGASDDGGSSGGGGGDAYDIGIVQFSSSEETTEAAIQGYVDYAEEQGWSTSKVDPQGSVDKAISAMNDFVQKGVDAIVVAVFPSETLTAGVRAATAAGIPVISIAGGTAEGVPVSADSGAPNATEVSQLLVDDMGDEGGAALVLGYKSGLPCLGREEELNSILDGTDIEVTREEVPIPGQVEGGTQFAQAWLAKNPEGSGNLAIWACFDDPALGAISALRQAGRDDVKVYGINGTPAAVQAVEDGDMRATAYLDAPAGGKAIGEKTAEVIEAGPEMAPETVPIPTFLVTEDSLAEFAETYPEAAAR
ncbi:MAG: sugar ABC transporter substrate-binding protein [Nocardioides sp.]|nr:sugar ABC transporter substrate-binding protein [Nocardioides sp.]